MLNLIRCLVTLTLLCAVTVATAREPASPNDLRVEIIDDYNRPLRQYPVRHGDGFAIHRAYLEAERDQTYAIRVENTSGRRIGLVIAVDGRNIISGDKSHLQPTERMYILNPYEQAVYRGWRTGRDRVNTFYFTDAGASYADAWGDRSAMGVIAVAAFREQERRRRDEPSIYGGSPEQRAPQKSQPGTGFGEEEWSPSRRVEFDPVRQSFAQVFLKYEWRNELCRKGIIDCRPPRPEPRNRFWDDQWYDRDSGYAPYPPHRR